MIKTGEKKTLKNKTFLIRYKKGVFMFILGSQIKFLQKNLRKGLVYTYIFLCKLAARYGLISSINVCL